METTFTPTNLSGAIIKTVIDWYFATQGRIFIKVDIEHPGFASTYPLPPASIIVEPVVAMDENRPGEHLQLALKSMLFNITLEATGNLRHDYDSIEFMARFDGRATTISIPYDALIVIYNPDTGEGWQNTKFIPSSLKRISIDDSKSKPVKEEPKKNHLSVVRNLH